MATPRSHPRPLLRFLSSTGIPLAIGSVLVLGWFVKQGVYLAQADTCTPNTHVKLMVVGAPRGTRCHTIVANSAYTDLCCRVDALRTANEHVQYTVEEQYKHS